jgi:putative addiction module component (TIGR02574 family)
MSGCSGTDCARIISVGTSCLILRGVTFMDISAALMEIKTLSIDERIRLVQAIWDSISAESEHLELSPAQRIELARRQADHTANPTDVISWEEVKAQARARSPQ